MEQKIVTMVVDEKFFEDPARKKVLEARMDTDLVFLKSKRGEWRSILFMILPALLIFALIYFFFFRQFRGAGGIPGGVLSFGNSRARISGKERSKVTFDDVAGIEEAKDEVQEIVEFLKDPARFRRLGGRIPRGVLLVGAPGTGKTLLAKAIAGEAGVPFLSISGSDFVEMFVGVGASRVRDLFRQAKENSPCIIFLDEIDAVGRKRGSGLGGGHDEREQTLNAILVEMDGFETDEKIILMAATNRPDVLDPALLRPGRFDREIIIDLPDLRGREAILKVHARKVILAPDVDMAKVARLTPSFSGAELEAVINEAAIMGVMRNRDAVMMSELEDARDKIRFGREKRSRVMDERDRRITAFHESGHAILSKVLEDVDPLHKVCIIPRGRSLGATMSLPEKDEYHLLKKRVLAEITAALGGRVAEETFCDDITAGAQQDIERATKLARYMVTKWGMSDALGPIDYSEDGEHLFLGKELARARNYSESTALKIDNEVRRIVSQCMDRARSLIEAHRSQTESIAEALLLYETLDGDDVDMIMQGKDLGKKKQIVYEPVDSDDKAPQDDNPPGDGG
jgi:cell division protease FtsH